MYGEASQLQSGYVRFDRRGHVNMYDYKQPQTYIDMLLLAIKS